eukprot:7333061-Alexandrium_andersonii.AAC.1
MFARAPPAAPPQDIEAHSAVRPWPPSKVTSPFVRRGESANASNNRCNTLARKTSSWAIAPRAKTACSPCLLYTSDAADDM